MKNLFLTTFVLMLSCDEINESIIENKEDIDTTPPTISIQSLNAGDFINEYELISVSVIDDVEIYKVEFFIDDSLQFTDLESPYEFEFDGTEFEDSTTVKFKVKSYDTSDNISMVEIELIVIKNPNSILLYSPTITENYFSFSWSKSIDGDFSTYTLYASQDTSFTNKTAIYSSTDIHTTNYDYYIGSHFNNFYMVSVSDTNGYSSNSNVENSWIKFTIDTGSYDEGGNIESIKILSDSTYLAFTEKGCGLRKYDLYGNEIFNNNYNDGNNCQLFNITNDGGAILLWWGSTMGGNRVQLHLIKLNINLNIEWENEMEFYDPLSFYSIEQISNGNYVISVLKSLNDRDGGMFILDSEGELLSYLLDYDQEAGIYTLYPQYVKEAQDGGFIMVGSGIFNENDNYYNSLFLLKTDSEGVFQWVNHTYGLHYGEFESFIGDGGVYLHETEYGNFLVVGWTHAFTSGQGEDAFLVKFNSNGNNLWSRHYEGTQYENWYFVDECIDGGLILGGAYGSGSNGRLAKTDHVGNILWDINFDSIEMDFGDMIKEVHQTPDGGFIAGGYGIIIKIDPFGNYSTNNP